jgi:hypothetical protein
MKSRAAMFEICLDPYAMWTLGTGIINRNSNTAILLAEVLWLTDYSGGGT